MTWAKDNIFWQICHDDAMGDVIVLVTPIKFTFNGQEYEVPAGFASDGMSVPRFFWRMLSPKLDFHTLVPSVIHDYMYSVKLGTRSEADEFYYQNLIAGGFGKVKAKLVWLGVRLGGGSHWGTN